MFLISPESSMNVDDLQSITLNKADTVSDRYQPIQHADFVLTIHRLAEDMGFQIANSEWMVKNSDQVLYGRVDVIPGTIPEISDRGDIYISLGARQSTDGRYAMVFFSGAVDIAKRSNYMLREIEYRRRHTINASDEDVVENALYEFIEDAKQIVISIDKLQRVQASDQEMAYVIVRLMEMKLIPKMKIMDIWKSWKTATALNKKNYNGYEIYMSVMASMRSSLPHKQLAVMRELEFLMKEAL